MLLRQPSAENFYRGNQEKYIKSFLKDFTVPDLPSRIVGGIVPHAGWMFSGAIAAKVFKCIEEKSSPGRFILFGAVHTWGVRKNSIYPRGEWATPLGELGVDEEYAQKILEENEGLIIEDPQAHSGEHSIEVQTPFIKYFFPDAKIIPIAIMPNDEAIKIGEGIAKVIKESGNGTVVIGTTDLTHYGDAYGFTPAGYGSKALQWMKENDRKIVDLALSLKPDAVLKEARTNRNACGSGAMAATITIAKNLGVSEGKLIDYTTSFDIMPDREFQMAVGYAGIIF